MYFKIFATLTSSFTDDYTDINHCVVAGTGGNTIPQYQADRANQSNRPWNIHWKMAVYEELAPLLRRLDIQNNQIEELTAAD